MFHGAIIYKQNRVAWWDNRNRGTEYLSGTKIKGDLGKVLLEESASREASQISLPTQRKLTPLRVDTQSTYHSRIDAVDSNFMLTEPTSHHRHTET